MRKELRWRLKKWFKNNQIWTNFLCNLLFIYLKVTYKTSRFVFNYQDSFEKDAFNNSKSTIYALWHNRLAFGPRIFRDHHQHIYALASPHSDGKIISKIINSFGFKILEGSSNKNSVGALKQIITKLKNGGDIVITPDGPRGPVYNVGSSNITEIALKYGAKLVPISCMSSNFFSLKSWDRLMIPLPFGTIYVIVGSSITLLSDKQTNDANLENQLKALSQIAEDKILSK